MTGKLSKLKASVDHLKGDIPQLITTADIICVLDGRFLSDIGVPAGRSPNARKGRAISSFANELGLRRSRHSVRVRDSAGHRTTAALWELPARAQR